MTDSRGAASLEETAFATSETRPKVLVLVGFNPGVSASVSERFGAEGFRIAVISRNIERHSLRVEALQQKGLQVSSLQADTTDPDSIQNAPREVRLQCGPTTVLHWNASGGEPRDLLIADTASIQGLFDVSVVGLLAAVQEALPDLERNGAGAVLVITGEVDVSKSASALEEARKRVVGVSDDEVGETYWKVDHGIRLTGMPSFQKNLSSEETWQVSWLMKSADKPLSPEVQMILSKAEGTLS